MEEYNIGDKVTIHGGYGVLVAIDEITKKSAKRGDLTTKNHGKFNSDGFEFGDSMSRSHFRLTKPKDYKDIEIQRARHHIGNLRNKHMTDDQAIKVWAFIKQLINK